ncbi:hypothetical protein Trydic_g14023 [Trypoxylus dichotomus]
MPGIRCSVKSCKNSYYQYPSLHFFRYPKDEERAKTWVLFANPNLIQNNLQNYRICSIHFEGRMFTNYLQDRLLPSAVPTIFLGVEGSSKICEKLEEDSDESMNSISCSMPETIVIQTTTNHEVPAQQESPSIPCQTAEILSTVDLQKAKVGIGLLDKEKKMRRLKAEARQLKARLNKPSLEAICHLSPARRRRYSRRLKKLCLSIYLLSPKAYKLLRTIFLLPTKTSLERIATSLGYKPEIEQKSVL